MKLANKRTRISGSEGSRAFRRGPTRGQQTMTPELDRSSLAATLAISPEAFENQRLRVTKRRPNDRPTAVLPEMHLDSVPQPGGVRRKPRRAGNLSEWREPVARLRTT